MFHLSTPPHPPPQKKENPQKATGSTKFSGDIEIEYWCEIMG